MSAAAHKLTELEIAQALKALPDWRLEDGKICVTYKFADFSQAWAFMTRCALAAEKSDHHPDWKNVYNTVEISLWTHDCGAVTNRDLQLAKQFSSFASDLL
jgi:4a-hydroxytetrahydrobiopterin dehydratase